MPTWPVALPQKPLLSGLARSPKSNVVAFGTEVGPGKQRRRSTARMQVWSLQFSLTDAQRATFESFFEDDLSDGALAFDWEDPVTESAASWKFSVQNPFNLTPRGGARWTLAVNLEKQP
jgi:hypothetical protein